MKTSKYNQKGFTLVELLIVIAVIAILSMIAIPNFNQAMLNSKKTVVKANVRTLIGAKYQFTVTNNGKSPTSENLDEVLYLAGVSQNKPEGVTYNINEQGNVVATIAFSDDINENND